jgi:hypothetical protein
VPFFPGRRLTGLGSEVGGRGKHGLAEKDWTYCCLRLWGRRLHGLAAEYIEAVPREGPRPTGMVLGSVRSGQPVAGAVEEVEVVEEGQGCHQTQLLAGLQSLFLDILAHRVER